MHIYAFGSICRGEVFKNSDVDLLVITDDQEEHFDPIIYSVYSYRRIDEIWAEGNPFAWHLYKEAKLIFGENNLDYIKKLGKPCKYKKCYDDCQKFMNIFEDARLSLSVQRKSTILDLSTIFLSIRNFATCFSLGYFNEYNFSRHSALKLKKFEITIEDVYKRQACK